MNAFKRCREKAGLKQSEVGEALNLSHSTISMWEIGATLPRADMFPKIAKLYGCTIDDLYDTKNDPAQPPEEAAL